MSGPRHRLYPDDPPPPDLARQQLLERENARLLAENKALRSVVTTVNRLAQPYVAKPEPTSRTLVRPYTANK